MEKKINQNRKGSALFTVISVMMILLVLVMGTFVVVTAAQKKAMFNYYNNQSYVTAKSVLDVFVNQAITTGPPATPLPAATKVIRESLIGTLSGTRMVRGMKYPGWTPAELSLGKGTEDPNVLNDLGQPCFYIDVDVTLPPDVATLGKISNQFAGASSPSTIRVYRYDKTTFKIIVSAESGVDDSKSIRTVSRKVNLKPQISKGMFESSLITMGSGNNLSSGAQVYGGFVTVSNSISPSAFLSGEVRLVGNYYSNAELISSAAGTQIHLSYEVLKDATGAAVKSVEYVETRKDFQPQGIYVYNKSDDPTMQPYILVGRDMKPNGAYTVMGKFGKPTKPIDIYVEQNLTFDQNGNSGIVGGSGTEIYGNVYCKGVVTMPDRLYTQITNAGFGVYTTTGTYQKSSGGTGVCSVLGAPFPAAHDYARPDYPSTDNFLSGLDYAGNSIPGATDYLNDVTRYFGRTIYRTTPTQVGGNTNIIINGVGHFKVDGSGGFEGSTNRWVFTSGSRMIITPSSLTNDIWIVTPPNVEFRDNTEILVDNSANNYDEILNKWDYNVYMYTPSGGTIKSYGAKIGYSVDTRKDYTIGRFGYNEFTNQYHYFGTHPVPDTSKYKERPSNFYWAVAGNGGGSGTEFSGCSLNGYMYAPELQITATSSPATINGNSYYNNIKIPTNYYTNPGAINQTVIGSIIGDLAVLNGTTGMIYVVPAESIFSSNSSSTLDKYEWDLEYYYTS